MGLFYHPIHELFLKEYLSVGRKSFLKFESCGTLNLPFTEWGNGGLERVGQWGQPCYRVWFTFWVCPEHLAASPDNSLLHPFVSLFYGSNHWLKSQCARKGISFQINAKVVEDLESLVNTPLLLIYEPCNFERWVRTTCGAPCVRVELLNRNSQSWLNWRIPVAKSLLWALVRHRVITKSWQYEWCHIPRVFKLRCVRTTSLVKNQAAGLPLNVSDSLALGGGWEYTFLTNSQEIFLGGYPLETIALSQCPPPLAPAQNIDVRGEVRSDIYVNKYNKFNVKNC